MGAQRFGRIKDAQQQTSDSPQEAHANVTKPHELKWCGLLRELRKIDPEKVHNREEVAQELEQLAAHFCNQATNGAAL